MVFITRVISLTNFMVASSALGFQVFVLYPWHKELDAGFEELKKEHLRVLDTIGSSSAFLSNEQRKAAQESLSGIGKRTWWFKF